MGHAKQPSKQRIDGIVLVNKPVGPSSNGVLRTVMRLLNAKKGGHTGALDPFATGLLPVCLGEATKISGLLLDSDKRYVATLKLGEQTDTGDKEGNCIQVQDVPLLDSLRIQQALSQFVGRIDQVPPMYSALKHKGKPLYHYARQGIEIDRPARKVTIKELKFLAYDNDTLVFEVLCSKGTYVRTLGEEIAKSLGTVGHLVALHRTQTGVLSAKQMLTLEELEVQGMQAIYPLDIALTHLQHFELSKEEATLIRHGQMLSYPKPKTEFVRLYDEGVCFAVGEWSDKKQKLKPKRVFNLHAASAC